MIKIPALFVISMLLYLCANSQNVTVDIWKRNVPNAKVNRAYALEADSSGGWTYVRNIANPSMDAYLAPQSSIPTTAVLICPGGGYWGIAYKHEGYQIAQWLNKLGISAFVLKYRLPDSTIEVSKSIAPLQDALEAMRIIRRNANRWNIDRNKIGIMGFSAGGHLASSVATHYTSNIYNATDTTSAKPNFSILIYPVISMKSALTHAGSRDNLLGKNPTDNEITYFSNELQVSALTPPTFIVHSIDDGAVPVENSIEYALALKRSGVPAELHIYQSGGHGYGLGRSSNTETLWPTHCAMWLKTNGWIR